MSSQRLTPRIPVADAVPLFPGNRNPRMLAWVVIAITALPASLAVLDDRAGFRLVMAALAVTVLTAGVGLLVMFRSIEPGVVRVDAEARSLRFAPSAAATVPVLAIAVGLLLPAIAQLVVDTQGLPTMSGPVVSVAPYLLGILGVAILAVKLWRLRAPSGLELTPTGLRGIRGHGVLDLAWDDLARVDAEAGPAAKLVLVPQGGRGRPVLAPALALGSDPNQVAAIARFFLEHPGDRAALSDGGAESVGRAANALIPGR